MSNVIPLYSQKKPIQHLIRIGHRILEDLHTAGRAPITTSVIDACDLIRQKELINTLSNSGVEIILDTKTAELASLSGINSTARELPWANRNRVHEPNDWMGQKGSDLTKLIADFAIANGVDTVLSPTHFIQESNSHWLVNDIQASQNLRRTLDLSGGKETRIDYLLIVPIALLKEPSQLRNIAQQLKDAPVDNIWLHVSGYGMNGTPAGTKRYIEAAWELSRLKKPLIADKVGGLAGLTLAAFGAVGRICHGVAKKESFNISNWKRKPGAGGSESRVYFPQLDFIL